MASTSPDAADRRLPQARGQVVLRRAGPSVVAGGVLAWVLVRMGYDAGGYFPPAYLSAGTVALVACALLLLFTRPRYGLSIEALAAVAALGGLAGWTGLSSLWSAAPSAAVEAMQRDLVYLAILGLGLMAAGSGRYARQLVWLGLAVIAAICGGGLLARLAPDLISEPRAAYDIYRLSYPLSYWNAMGALAGVGTILAFGIAADPRTRWELRAVAASLSLLLVTTLALTLSRGAWIALFAGLAVLIALSAHRGSLTLTAAILVPAAALLLGRLFSYPALVDSPTAESGQEAAGHAFLPQLIVICAIASAAVGFVGAARSSSAVTARLDRMGRPLLLGGAAVIVALFAIGYAARAADVEGAAGRASREVDEWISTQWDDFMAPAGETTVGAGSARVTAGAGGSRSDVYRVALDQFAARPFGGSGAGSFEVHWLADRPVGEQVVNAHSLELETLAELGIVGFALLLAFLGAIAAAAVRSRRKPGGLPRAQSAAVGAACSVWIVHSAIDWDWQMPALTGVVLLLSCTLFPYGRTLGRRRRSSVR